MISYLSENVTSATTARGNYYIYILYLYLLRFNR